MTTEGEKRGREPFPCLKRDDLEAALEQFRKIANDLGTGNEEKKVTG